MHTALKTDFTYNGVTYAAGSDQEQIALGDNFLSKIVPQIEASQAFKNNGEIVIWNDETEGDTNAGTTNGFTSTEIIISPLAKGNAYTNDILYTHSSDLATLQNIFHVSGPDGYLGGAAGATTLADLYQAGAIPSAIPEPGHLGVDAHRLRGTGGGGRLSPQGRRRDQCRRRDLNTARFARFIESEPRARCSARGPHRAFRGRVRSAAPGRGTESQSRRRAPDAS